MCVMVRHFTKVSHKVRQKDSHVILAMLLAWYRLDVFPSKETKTGDRETAENNVQFTYFVEFLEKRNWHN